MRGAGWGPSPGGNPPPPRQHPGPVLTLMLQKILLEQVPELLGMSTGDLPTSGWTPMARASRGARNCWAPAALGPVPPPAARTDCAEIPPRLRVSRAAGASSFYKSAPGSDDETLSPPSFALCAEGTLKSQGAKAARTEQVGERARRAGTLGQWGLWRGDNALPTPGDTQSPDPPLCSSARLQDVAGQGNGAGSAAFPQGKRLGFYFKSPLKGREEGEAPFSN